MEKKLKKSMIQNKVFFILISCILISGCRGWITDKPPIHPNPNLDWQPKYKAQKFVQKVPDNTIKFRENKEIESIKVPYKVDKNLLNTGEEKYNIYCSTCHTKTGNGIKSVIAKRGWIPSNLLSEVTIEKSDKELYQIVKNGIRTMPGYKKKLNDYERWSVVLYLRTLQRAQNVELKELNKSDLKNIN